uniref:Uncharacterized protein n=1 Tax=Oryza brachyantha TaxID=4533 RepID=J3M8F5_ORYBR
MVTSLLFVSCLIKAAMLASSSVHQECVLLSTLFLYSFCSQMHLFGCKSPSGFFHVKFDIFYT